jgi:hypothetical protein
MGWHSASIANGKAGMANGTVPVGMPGTAWPMLALSLAMPVLSLAFIGLAGRFLPHAGRSMSLAVPMPGRKKTTGTPVVAR